MAAIKKRSLVDQVYERLRSDIITLRLPLGSKVNVNELQDTLGVSCTPIREAVNRLQQEGLVTYENNVGAKVLTLAPRDVEEIQQLATTLHCAAAKLSMERGDRKVMTEQLRRRQRNIYSFFKCPSCGTVLRVPKGKGRVRITCKSCGNVFERNS